MQHGENYESHWMRTAITSFILKLVRGWLTGILCDILGVEC
jgi:hypothetical protein